MADKVGMSLDQIIKLGKKGRSPMRGKGARGRGGVIINSANRGRGRMLAATPQGRGRGRGKFVGTGRARSGRGGNAVSTSTKTDFSQMRRGSSAPILDARDKLKFKVDAREKLKKRVDAKTNVKTKVDARENLQAKNLVRDTGESLKMKIYQNVRKEMRTSAFNERRTFNVTNAGLKVTTKQDEREAMLLNNSIRITAKGTVPSSPLSPPSTTTTPAMSSPRTLVGGGTVRVLMNDQQKSLPSLPKMHLSLDANVVKPKSSNLLEERLGALDEPLPVSKDKPVIGTRIVITNLHHQVSQRDIQELFGVIGQLQSAKLLHQGIAEVVYCSREDAIAALQKYHNRNLDGIPMQCKMDSLPTQPLYSPPSMRSDRLAASNKAVVFKVKI